MPAIGDEAEAASALESDCSRGNGPMRLVAGCLVAVMALVIYDDFAHSGRYRTAVGQMVGHMTSVTWKH